MTDSTEPCPDVAIESLAAEQHGVFSRTQAIDAGADATLIRRQVASGRWRRVAPGVYGFPGRPDSWLRRVWIAHLHGGPSTVVSHASAARLHGFHPIEGYPVDLTVGRNRTRSLADSRRHRVDDLDPSQVTTVRGLPVTTAERTAVDLATVLTPVRLREVPGNAHVDRVCRIEEVAVVFDSLRRSGKPGVRRMADALDELGPGDGIPRSVLERLLDEVIRLSGLPRPSHEVPIPGFGLVDGFVDRCWPEAKLIVEADGRRWHSRQSDLRRDHERDLQAAAAGYQTLRLMWERLKGRPDDTAHRVVEVYRLRIAHPA